MLHKGMEVTDRYVCVCVGEGGGRERVERVRCWIFLALSESKYLETGGEYSKFPLRY